MSDKSVSSINARRAELMAELFLQDLRPSFLVQPTFDAGYDFLMGAPNTKGGTNHFVVQVKTTVAPILGPFRITLKSYVSLAYSNIPAMLLVVDVKNNLLYFAWPAPGLERTDKARTISVGLRKVDDSVKSDLRSEIRKWASPSRECGSRRRGVSEESGAEYAKQIP